MDMRLITFRFAPSKDPSLSIKSYERTPEQQASLGYYVEPSQPAEAQGGASTGGVDASNQVRGVAHGSVGAKAGHRAIAQSNSAEIAEAFFRYTAPEEVMELFNFFVLILFSSF